jgi:hypothetical protein
MESSWIGWWEESCDRLCGDRGRGGGVYEVPETVSHCDLFRLRPWHMCVGEDEKGVVELGEQQDVRKRNWER